MGRARHDPHLPGRDVFYGGAPLRRYVPSGLRAENATLAAPDLAAALRLTYLDAPHPATAGVYTREDTKRQIGVYVYRGADDKERAELSYLDEAGVLTILRVVGEGGDSDRWFGELGGRLLVYHLRGPRLIGAGERRNQIVGNFAKTLMGRQLELGGFRERNYLNVQPPGYWGNERGQPWAGKPGERRAKFVPTSLPTGPATDRFLQGAEMCGPDGEFRGFANPSLAYEDPVSLAEPERGLQNARLSILASTGQPYLALTGEGAASAVARIQARAAHEARLGPRKAMLDAGIRWHLQTEARMAAIAFPGVSFVAEFRAEANSIVDTGPIAPDERLGLLQQAEVGRLSDETFLARTGEDDPATELERIGAAQLARDNATMRAVGVRPVAPPQGGTGANPEDVVAGELGRGAA